MVRWWRSREKESDSDNEDESNKSVINLSSDDEEANKDLSLEVVAKSRLRKTQKNKFKDKVGEIFIDFSNSEIEDVSNGKIRVKRRKNRMKKSNKKEFDEVIAQEEETNGTSNSVLEVGNGESNNVVLRKLLRGPRYFDEVYGNWETCYNCGEEGHIAANCREERRQKPCFVCGIFGHNAKHCLQGQDCFICKRRGHLAKECPDKHKITSEESIICLRCGDLGHDMAFCKNDYPSSDMKEIQCYVCKKFGHLCCVDYKDNGPIEISCYNCAQIGHTGQGCAKQRFESNSVTPPTLCFRCGKEGHFARGCTKEPKSFKRLGESSTPINRLKVKKDFKVSKSLPKDFGIEHKKKRPYFDKSMRNVKSKIKGGWIVDDELGYQPKRRHEVKDWASPTTPSGRTKKFHSPFSDRRNFGYSNYSSPHTPHQRYNFHPGTPFMRNSTGGYRYGSPASRFGYSDGFYN